MHWEVFSALKGAQCIGGYPQYPQCIAGCSASWGGGGGGNDIIALGES